MPTGTALHHVGGGDRTTPLPSVVTYPDPWTNPKKKITGLDWSKHRAPEPGPTPEPAAIEIPATPPAAKPKRITPTKRKPAPRAKKATPSRPKTRAASRRTSIVDVPTARAEYLAGATVTEIAAAHDWPIISVRRQLQRAGVTMRDDRAHRSGGHKAESQNPALVDQIRSLYVDSGLSQSQVATAVGCSPHTVQRIMQRNNIPTREGQSGSGDTLQPYRERLERLDISTKELRAWAVANHYDIPDRGLLPVKIVDLYEASIA